MSLLGSIFGTGKDEPTTTTAVANSSKKQKTKGKKAEKDIESGLPDLFAKSTQLPERPVHEPAKPRAEKRKKQEAEEDDPTKKKRRKPRKTTTEEEATEADTKSNENDETKESINEKPEVDDVDDAEARTIFVGNIPLQGASRKSLAALFKDCGTIESTRIRSVPVKGIKLPPQRAGDQNLMKKVCVNTNLVDNENAMKDTVMGYVVFKTEESVIEALKLNNNLVVDGRRLRVDRASPSVEPSRSVFIGNLPYAADETTLQDHFVKGCALEVGDVEAVRIIRDKETYQCKGFGYVLLKEKSMIPTALKLHDSVYMKKNIRVLVCGKRFKNKKGLVAASKVRSGTPDVKGTATAPKETVTVGAFRRILAKQSKEVAKITKRKRGEKKKSSSTAGGKKGSSGQAGVSKRAALEKKVEKRVKKIQKRISKGMGKARR